MVDDGKVFLCVMMVFVILLSTGGFHRAIKQFCFARWLTPMMRGQMMKCKSNPSNDAAAVKLCGLRVTRRNAFLRGILATILTIAVIAIAAWIFYANIFSPSVRLT